MNTGVYAALAAASLFGVGTPLAKLLLNQTSPWLLAGLLYLGSGVGLWLLRAARRSRTGMERLSAPDWRWLGPAIASGGVLGPVLLMTGLAAMPASGAALLLNAESVFTALLAWFAFKENFDRRIALGMFAIVAGAVVLGWPTDGRIRFASLWPTLAVLGACLAWAVDNNLTRKVALADSSYIAMVKGLTAGATNLGLAIALGATWPGNATVLAAAIVGFLGYGASLALFVFALRHLGTARTAAYFGVAPFFGAAVAIPLLGEPIDMQLVTGAVLMATGVVLHVTERHVHEHLHDAVDHTHEHIHDAGDEHHDHEHDEPVPSGTRHTHRHRHTPIRHTHRHYPDSHHRHTH